MHNATATEIERWAAAVRSGKGLRAEQTQGLPYLVQRMGRAKDGSVCMAAARAATQVEAQELADIARRTPRAGKVSVLRWDGARWIDA